MLSVDRSRAKEPSLKARSMMFRSPNSGEKAEPAQIQPPSVCYPGIHEVSVRVRTHDVYIFALVGWNTMPRS
jgi:hypothetical protein